MAVDLTPTSVVYRVTQSAIGTEYPIVFSFMDAGDVNARYTPEGGEIVVLTEFAVAGRNLVTTKEIPVGATLAIFRETPVTQEILWVDGQAIYAPAIMRGDDKLTMIVQELSEDVNRAIQVTIEDEAAGYTANDIKNTLLNSRNEAEASAARSEESALRSEAAAVDSENVRDMVANIMESVDAETFPIVTSVTRGLLPAGGKPGDTAIMGDNGIGAWGDALGTVMSVDGIKPDPKTKNVQLRHVVPAAEVQNISEPGTYLIPVGDTYDPEGPTAVFPTRKIETIAPLQGGDTLAKDLQLTIDRAGRFYPTLHGTYGAMRFASSNKAQMENDDSAATPKHIYDQIAMHADGAHPASEGKKHVTQAQIDDWNSVSNVSKEPGPPGKDGEKGEPGPPGRDGIDGAPGAPGRDGADGTPGKDGADGAPGLPGAPGTPGKDGADGARGVSGAAATIELGTVSTGAAGTDVIINNRGTSSAAVFDFTIPRGDTGATGAPGSGGGGGDGMRGRAVHLLKEGWTGTLPSTHPWQLGDILLCVATEKISVGFLGGLVTVFPGDILEITEATFTSIARYRAALIGNISSPFPSGKVIDISTGNTELQYTAPSDGFLCASVTDWNSYISIELMGTEGNGIVTSASASESMINAGIMAAAYTPMRKGQTATVKCSEWYFSLQFVPTFGASGGFD